MPTSGPNDPQLSAERERICAPIPSAHAWGRGDSSRPHTDRFPSPRTGEGSGRCLASPRHRGIRHPSATFSLGPLEFQKVREMVAARTSFSAGRELALALEPSPDAFLVERWQASTEEARRLPTLKPGLTLGGAHDIRPVVQRAHLGGILQPLELLDVASTARVSRIWRSTVVRLRDSLPMLANVAARLADLQRRRGGDQPRHRARRRGPRRRQPEAAPGPARPPDRPRPDDEPASVAAHSMRTSLQDAVITQRNGRYVLPVKSDERGRVKGIVHDQSASGQTLFIEPLPIVEAGNRIRGLEAEERHEVERILRELSNRVAHPPRRARRQRRGAGRAGPAPRQGAPRRRDGRRPPDPPRAPPPQPDPADRRACSRPGTRCCGARSCR